MGVSIQRVWTGICRNGGGGVLRHLGHLVVGVDVNRAKVETFGSGHSPIIEDGVDDLLAEGHQKGRIRATNDVTVAVQESDISVISRRHSQSAQRQD